MCSSDLDGRAEAQIAEYVFRISLKGPLQRNFSLKGGVDDIQVRRHGKPTTFRIMARIAPDGRVSAVRFITTTGAGGDSRWNPPVE